MDKFKTVLIFTLVGALLGNGAASLISPRYQVWNNSAPLADTTQCKLPEMIAKTTATLIHDQLLGSVIGAVAFLVLSIFFLVFQSRRQKRKATPPPPAAPTPTAG